MTSVSHDYKWSVQTNARLMVADVGNSRTKIAIIERGIDHQIKVIAQVSDDEGEQAVSAFVLRHIKDGVPQVIHSISVNPDRLKQLRECFSAQSVEVREIKKSPVRNVRSLYDLNAIGCDRLALLEAAQYLYSRGQLPWPAMCVSLGTATTIDHIDGSGQHLGGFISAGLQTSVDAISNRGAMLPKNIVFETAYTGDAWPTNSADAMARASMESTVSFIQSEQSRLAAHCHVAVSAVQILLTGGFAGVVNEYLQDKCKMEARTTNREQSGQSLIVDANLILLGAGVLALNGR